MVFISLLCQQLTNLSNFTYKVLNEWMIYSCLKVLYHKRYDRDMLLFLNLLVRNRRRYHHSERSLVSKSTLDVGKKQPKTK